MIWYDGQDQLGRITVFESAGNYLIGNTLQLITEDAIDPKSEAMKAFLGSAKESRITLDVPSINLEHTTYYYPSRGMEVTLKDNNGNKGVVFALVPVAE